MSAPRITYVPRRNVTQESQLNALSSVYRIILNCRAKKNAAGVTSTNGADAMKGSVDDRAKHIIQEPK